jgi:VIT1/CCC1 family predicted Fe2+/Mn2+ transporter
VTLAEIEQAKHTASWLNSLASALASAGAFVPIFTFVFGLAPKIDLWVLIGISIICLFMAWALHMIGREILGSIVQ